MASEVRCLDGRSAEAAREIRSLINASVERVEAGTTLVDQAGATMEQVVSSIQQVTEIVGRISTASHEQSEGVAQLGEAVIAFETLPNKTLRWWKKLTLLHDAEGRRIQLVANRV